MSGVLPGTTVTIGDSAPRSFTPGDTGTAFVVGLAERGPVDKPALITSLAGYSQVFGDRVAYGALYDCLDANFREAHARQVGLQVYVLRLVGAEAKASTDNIEDGEDPTLKLDASSPGEWGDDIEWKVTAGSAEGTFRITVSYKESVVEVSPDLASNLEAVAWASTSSYIRITDLAGGNPAVSEGALAGGDDDREEVDAETIEDALPLFTDDLGPGQVAAPGYTTEAIHKAVMEHCESFTRTPILDGEDTAEAESLLEDAGALRALSGGRHAGLFAPWITIPGITTGTTRTVPPSAIMLGLIAASDRQNGHANIAVAGPNGRSSYAIGVTQTYTAEERGELNSAGVNVAIMDEGQVINYGYRTLANPVTNAPWVNLAAARLMMDLAFGAKRVLKRKEFATLDAQGETRSSAEGAILGEVVTPRFEQRAIFGETIEDACSVTVEQDVDPEDGSIGKLSGTLAAKPSPYAERIEFTVVNIPTTTSL